MEKGIWVQLLLPMALPEMPKRKKPARTRKAQVLPVSVQLNLRFDLAALISFKPRKPSLFKRAIVWVSNRLNKLFRSHVGR
ncbi:hypothetical protein [Pontibacterium sp.]|uniref:hypothetical protein n=1 Tax=Pontibacterium sp. TaxID=2036026 RepID=UPI0035612EEC